MPALLDREAYELFGARRDGVIKVAIEVSKQRNDNIDRNC